MLPDEILPVFQERQLFVKEGAYDLRPSRYVMQFEL